MTNPNVLRLLSLSGVALLATLSAPASAQHVQGAAHPAGAKDPAWRNAISTTLGRPGVEFPGGVYRVGLPRTDLSVTLDGVAIRPGFALGSWLAFQPHAAGVMVMGDLVLLEREVPGVMRRLAAAGIEITALHNHVLRAQPTTMYMHVPGQGEPTALATALRAGLAESGTPLQASPPAAAPASDGMDGLDTAAFARALGREGRDEIRDHGSTVPPGPFGLGTAINLQSAGGGRGAITGDFVLLPDEVVPVQRALLENGIDVTAIHSHMIHEEPRLIFMHFWAVNDPETLGRGLRAALDRTASRPAGG
jgi:hypothetical protein